MECFWSYLTPQPYAFCERQLCSWIQQPANTWSNVGYLIAAIAILASKRKGLEKNFYFCSTFALFIGSTFFHMSGTHVGKLMDVGSMLVLSMGICSLSVQQYLRLAYKKVLMVFLAGLAFNFLFLYTFGFGNVPFGFEILVAILLEIRMLREGRSLLIPKRLLLACGIELVAAIFLLLDVSRAWCDPDNHILNGHAIWHLLSGLTIYLIFSARKSFGPSPFGPSPIMNSHSIGNS